MATAVQKIALSSSRDIPFNKLVLSQTNVRKTKAGVSVEELAEDIARRGLLQGLNVRPVLDAKGNATGVYEVPAGGRRYQALALLVKQKRLPKTAPVPCVVRDPSVAILAEDDSLAENVQHVPLHPLDQFRALQVLRSKGQSEEDIAAAFFVSVHVVKQRLRLASVSPKLLDTYAEDGMSLEQLMAFAVNPDHARQEQVWETLQRSWSQEPYQIRRLLTETAVRATDKRARFVGIDTYEAAGGTVLRDLFQADDGCWLEDMALLDTLVTDRLRAEAETIAAEGWKWIEAAVDFPYGHDRGLRALDGAPAALSEEERATREALQTKLDRLMADYEGADELPDEVDARLGEIEAALETFESRPRIFDPADIDRAGVFVSVDHNGNLLVERGYVRPEDEASVERPDETGGDVDGGKAAQHAAVTVDRQPAEPDEDDAIRPLPEKLVMELTAERTLALRDKLARDPSVAFLAVLHAFCRNVFSRYASHGLAMGVSVRGTVFPAQAPGLKDTPYARAIAARHKAWEERLPKDEAGLWDALVALDRSDQAALFAHCAAFGVNALQERGDRIAGGMITARGVRQRLAEADKLASAVGLDMAEAGWRPTVGNYLGRVTKARILEAVREGAGDRAAQLVDHLKKGDMAKEAERLLADSGWLPESLRLPQPDDQAPEDGRASSEADALPAFLAGDTAAEAGEVPSSEDAAE